MLTIIETIVFFLTLIMTFYGFFQPLYLRYRLIRLGQPDNRFDHPLKRLINALISFFFVQCSVKKERIFTGLIHFFILYGSLTFDTVTVNHIFEGFLPNFRLFGHGWLGKIHSFMVDGFAIMVILAALYFIIRRYLVRPPSYEYPAKDSIIIYSLLITVTLTFLLYEGALIRLHPDHAMNAFLGQWLAPLFAPSLLWVKIYWWIHLINVFLFIIYVPRSKYIHMMFGPLNIAFHNDTPYSIIPPIDIEKAEYFGASTISQFKWKDHFDSFACIDCGRCQDYCPASTTKKKLSPKDIMIHLRQGLMNNRKTILKTNSQDSLALMGTIYSPEEIWACTTCGACMQVCPVKNEHVPKIIGLRQGQVLMEGKFPNELKNTFKGMQVNANPWDIGNNNRLNWAEGLNIPLIKDHPEAEYLLFLGCAAAFDDRAQKMSLALIQFLNQAGISYAVLGENESCCGETARRLGEEGLGQTLMTANIELFKELKIKKIITPCPHCFNTFKNEYPLMNFNIEVIHHTMLIQRLLKEKKIQPSHKIAKRVAIHDSCYLGRANSLYAPSRDIHAHLSSTRLKEHKYAKDHGFCCGAGGGLFWVEEKEPRINHQRLQQLESLHPEIIATSCPYCLKMLDDAVKDANQEDKIKVRDWVEIYMETLNQ